MTASCSPPTPGAPTFAFEPKDWYLALAAEIPGADGKLAANTNKTWKQVNAAFPEWTIAAYIPGEKHGTREVFEEKTLHAGCVKAGAHEAMVKGGMDKAAADKACIKVRKDGVAVDIDGDYTETLARLQSNKQGIGVFGLSFYENNTDKLKVATMGGVAPSVETVATGKYPVSRPLFFYVKKAHVGVIPGLKEYVEFFTSDRMHRRQGSAGRLWPGSAARLRAQGGPGARRRTARPCNSRRPSVLSGRRNGASAVRKKGAEADQFRLRRLIASGSFECPTAS